MTNTTPFRSAFLAARAALKTADEAYDACSCAECEDSCKAAPALDAAEAALAEARQAFLDSDEEFEWTVRDVASGVTHVFMSAALNWAQDTAIEWAEGGDYDLSAGPVYVDLRLAMETDDGYESGRGSDDEEQLTAVVASKEPSCSHDDGHDWQSPHVIVGGIEENPGVWGKGGGVIISECCMRCGCKRTTDTWAQRMDTGEQGLTEVSYEPGYYSEALSELESDAA